MEEVPLLSICIPTYNRVDSLKRCIDSIINNKEYNSRIVEIVVSDNCSSDGTNKLMQHYIDKNDSIIYNRNSENIGGERNFLKVLSLANGHFIKLHNDYCEFSKDGLSFLIKIIEANKIEKPPVFFEISNSKLIKSFYCNSLDEFVRKEDLKLSWISAIGMWKEEYSDLPNKDAAISLQFMQTDWWLRLALKKDRILVCRGDIFHRFSFSQNHGDFDYIGIFLNYPKVFQPLIEKGIISRRTQRIIDFRLLQSLSGWYYRLNIKKDAHYSYLHNNSYSKLKNYFSKYPLWKFWLLLFLLKAIVSESLSFIKRNK